MKFALILLTFIVSIGLLSTENIPLLVKITIAGIMMVILVVQLWLERQEQKEASDLRAKLTEIHSKETARPSFELSINGTTVDSKQQWIPARNIQGDFPFVIKLRNIGMATALDVQAFLWVPENIHIPFLGKYWFSNGVPVKLGSDGEELVKGVKEYGFIAPVAINMGNWLSLGNGRLPIFPYNVAICMRLKVYANGGVFQEWTFGIRINKDD